MGIQVKLRSFFISLFCFCIFIFSNNCRSYKEIQIKDGILNLPELTNDQVILLDGEWEIYWNIHNDWQDLDSKNKNPLITHVPSSWNKINPSENKSNGYASYRLRINNLKKDQKYFFKIKNQSTAYNFYINRIKFASAGVVGETKALSTPQYKVNYVSFKPKDSHAEILLTVSNFHHARGGFRYPIEFGSEEIIYDYSILYAAFELLVMGSILTMGFFHLILFFIRDQIQSYLYFSIFCFINALRIFILDNFYITYFIPNISWELLVKLDYATTPILAPVFLEYLRKMYPNDVQRLGSKLVFYASLLSAIITLLTPPDFFTSILYLNNAIVGLAIFLSTYAILKINHYRRNQSKLLLVGTVILMLFAVHDLLAGSRIIEDDLKLPIGLFLFFVIQSIILSKRNSETFNHALELSEEYQKISQDLEQLNRNYSKFVSREYIKLINDSNILKLKCGDFSSKNLSILSSDIRGFTSFSEQFSPQDNFRFLNAYLKRVVPVITQNNGHIEKFIGDAVIALFTEGTNKAIDTAIEMHRVVNDYNFYRIKKGNQAISIGIGIHHGETLLGILGEEERMQTSAVSESIYLASVIEGLTKKYGAKILVSVDALYASDSFDRFPYRIVDSVRLFKGAEPIGIAEILLEGLDETSNLKIEYKEIFERAVYYFLLGDFQESSNLFETMISQIDQDEAARLYYERSQKYLKYGAPPDWETSSSFED
ncbi:MAG: adenylate/guanylate cyclase domain-containing protein [Leptospiraceae bacterium]|nr:adenylate/guanylate cyclase domain-containing protein [Leptospiraceae bacterium]